MEGSELIKEIHDDASRNLKVKSFEEYFFFKTIQSTK